VIDRPAERVCGAAKYGVLVVVNRAVLNKIRDGVGVLSVAPGRPSERSNSSTSKLSLYSPVISGLMEMA